MNRLLKPLATIAGAQSIVLGVGWVISDEMGTDFRSTLFFETVILLFLGIFGFMFAGSSGMLARQPYNPHFAREVARGIREDQPSRFRASLVLLILGGMTLIISLLVG